MDVASSHAECHVTLVQDWKGVATVACEIWVGSGHPQPINHPGVCSSFIECLGKSQLWVQNACSVTPEVDRKLAEKKEETRVSKGF